MRSKEVLNLLRVTRPTLTKYVKSGKIKVIRKPNGHYEYDEESVYAFLNKDVRSFLYNKENRVVRHNSGAGTRR